MITKIVEQLKTGRIKNVVQYGVEQLPAPPYIVVRTEKDALGRGKLYRIIIHMQPGQEIFLDDYLINDLADLLDNFTTRSRHNNYNRLLTLNDYIDTIVSSDDGTISKERSFLMPSMIF